MLTQDTVTSIDPPVVAEMLSQATPAITQRDDVDPGP
jgi:hypothetical protein